MEQSGIDNNNRQNEAHQTCKEVQQLQPNQHYDLNSKNRGRLKLPQLEFYARKWKHER